MGKRHFKNWLETFTLNPADFPAHEWTLYNDTDEHIRLDYQGVSSPPLLGGFGIG